MTNNLPRLNIMHDYDVPTGKTPSDSVESRGATWSFDSFDENSQWSAQEQNNSATPMVERVGRRAGMVAPSCVHFAEPKDKQACHNKAKARLSVWDQFSSLDFPFAQATKRSARPDGEEFDVFEFVDGLSFVRHAKIHRSLLGWIESCSVAKKNPAFNTIMPTSLHGHSRVALKVFDLHQVAQSEAKEDALQELILNARLSRQGGENVSPMLCSFRTESLVIAVFPMYPKGDLFEYLSSLNRPLEETELRRLVVGAATALRTCHSLNICHRDISLENFCLDESFSPMLIDFGVAVEMAADGSLLHTGPIGKVKYMAPELSLSAVGGRLDGRKCDVFSLGVVLLLLVLQMEPWETASLNDARFRTMVFQGELESVLLMWGFSLSPSLMDLLKGMLCVDPVKRLGVEEVLNHPWTLAVSMEDLLPHPSAG